MVDDQLTKKRMRRMLIGVAILFGTIFLYKGFNALMLKWFLAHNQNAIVTITATKAEYSDWQPQLRATASLRAIRGVNVTTELAAMVRTIYFTPGSLVKKGDILVQLNADSDVAALHSLEANAELARVTYVRDKAQFEVQAVSKQTVDADAANLQSLKAQVQQQTATVAKKTIRAPFDGRLGINLVNPGQFINPGDSIVNLQTLDPLFADFYVPQQSLSELKVGQEVDLRSDTFPDRVFKGKITTINPAVDTGTRNVLVEATIENPHYDLAPGMFASLVVVTGPSGQQLTLPQTAISFNPYGELVYIVSKTGETKKGKETLTVKQSFVKTGGSRGDQIAILQGLKEGEMVVTSGQLKLKNGSPVVINNKLPPANNPSPRLPDDH